MLFQFLKVWLFQVFYDGDNFYVDGGITNNIPTDVDLEMGVDIIIAVDITSDEELIKNIDNLSAVVSGIFNYSRAKNTKINKELDDILIKPSLGVNSKYSILKNGYLEGSNSFSDNKYFNFQKKYLKSSGYLFYKNINSDYSFLKDSYTYGELFLGKNINLLLSLDLVGRYNLAWISYDLFDDSFKENYSP